VGCSRLDQEAGHPAGALALAKQASVGCQENEAKGGREGSVPKARKKRNFTLRRGAGRFWTRLAHPPHLPLHPLHTLSL